MSLGLQEGAGEPPQVPPHPQPQPRPHTHTPLFPHSAHPPTPTSTPYPLVSPVPSHLHTWACAAARGPKSAVFARPCPSLCACLHSHCTHPCAQPRKGVCTCAASCILVHTSSRTFLPAQFPLVIGNISVVLFAFPLPSFFPLKRK